MPPMFPVWQAPQPEESREPSEYEKRLAWVEEQFFGLGFNVMQSAALAEAGADWHEAHRLLRKNCPHHLVIDLLT